MKNSAGGMEIEQMADVEWIEESDIATIPSELDGDRTIAGNHESINEAEQYEGEEYSEGLKLVSFFIKRILKPLQMASYLSYNLDNITCLSVMDI